MFRSQPILCTLIAAASLCTPAAEAGRVGRIAPSAYQQIGPSAATWTESVIHAFHNPDLGGDDGSFPLAALLREPSGMLYSTTSSGGSKGGGTVFELIPPAPGKTAWTEKILYDFATSKGASTPSAGVIADAGGALYGTTATSGAGCYSGSCGTVFKLTPPAAGKTAWTETVLHNFVAAQGDGDSPVAALVMGAGGTLYGTTQRGGALNTGCHGICGTVFQVTPPAPGKTAWTETVLHTFTGGDGSTPDGSLILEGGALYGTTSTGGPRGYGTAFKLSPPAPGTSVWTETILHAFASSLDGAGPVAGLIVDKTGALYGTTTGGGATNRGTVFKLTPPASGKTGWTHTVLYSFGTNLADGSGYYPNAALIADNAGALYSTTLYGGATGYGTVFKLTPPAAGKTAWTPSALHEFTDANGDGGSPRASLVGDPSGNVYGTAYLGGLARVGAGIVFELHK